MKETSLLESNQSGASKGAPGPLCSNQLDDKALWIERGWKAALIGMLFFILFKEEITYLADMWSSPEESHGWLIPAFSLYFVYQKRDLLKRKFDISTIFILAGALLILLSLASYLYIGCIQKRYYIRQLAMLTTMAGIVLMLGGWRLFRISWLPVFFLFFGIPLPQRTYFAITMPLRRWASVIAAEVLNALPNVSCLAEGVTIRGEHLGVPINLDVAEACSGMRLLMAFVALGVAMAYLEKRPLAHRIVLVLSTIPIAILCNILRVLITGFIYIYMGPQYAEGLLHTLLGLVMLGVAFGFYGLLAWIMNRLFIDEDEPEAQGSVLIVRKGGQA